MREKMPSALVRLKMWQTHENALNFASFTDVALVSVNENFHILLLKLDSNSMHNVHSRSSFVLPLLGFRSRDDDINEKTNRFLKWLRYAFAAFCHSTWSGIIKSIWFNIFDAIIIYECVYWFDSAGKTTPNGHWSGGVWYTSVLDEGAATIASHWTLLGIQRRLNEEAARSDKIEENCVSVCCVAVWS